MDYPKRLIEVDLPIARISAHARREKSIRHGHISTLHIWWARRPLAACRAVICAALWPDPADPLCPDAFRETARTLMRTWAADQGKLHGAESFQRFIQGKQFPKLLDDNHRLRHALLDFIADFANWDNSTVPAYLDTSRALTQAAHEALGGAPGTRPLVVDPFAGGGSIPLEALRVGADAFASDLNPVAVLLNKVVLEYIPKYGQRLADEVRKWGEWIKREAEKELAEFYPERPGRRDAHRLSLGADDSMRRPRLRRGSAAHPLPLACQESNRPSPCNFVPNPKAKRVDFQIIVKQRDGWMDQADPKTKIETPKFDGAVKRGSATCPCCGYTTPVARVREQLKARRGGANDARLFCVVRTKPGEDGRSYRLPRKLDEYAFGAAVDESEPTCQRSRSRSRMLHKPGQGCRIAGHEIQGTEVLPKLSRLQALLDAQEARLKVLEATVARLKEQLAAARKNSSTSSKPPSSDIVKPKPPRVDGQNVLSAANPDTTSTCANPSRRSKSLFRDPQTRCLPRLRRHVRLNPTFPRSSSRSTSKRRR